MVKATLPLNDVPVVWVVIGRQHLRRTRDKVGNYGIYRHSLSGNKNPSLACRPEGRFHRCFPKFLGKLEGGVFLTQSTICSDGQKSLPRALLARADRYVLWWHPNISERPTESLCGF